MIDTLKSKEFDNAQNKIGHYYSKIGNLLLFSSKMQTISKKRSNGDTVSIFSLEGVELL